MKWIHIKPRGNQTSFWVLNNKRVYCEFAYYNLCFVTVNILFKY